MLDLDSLAEKRARSVNEETDGWHKAVWSLGFQKISASMSDGEVELLLAACSSYAQLEAVIVFLTARAGSARPYSILVDEARRAGKSLSEWIAGLRP